MENGPLHDDKLFRAVNERLSNYEAPYEGADWDAMSRSLDQLPKVSRFKWKISLNSILIGIGIVGISALAITLVKSSGKKTNVASPQENAQQVTTPKQAPPAGTNSFVVNTTQNVTADNNGVVLQDNHPVAADATSGITSSDNSTKAHRQKKDNGDGLYFGDQIDRRKGFIHHTQEDPELVNSHEDSIPGYYYDIVNGKTTKIRLKKDTASKKTSAPSQNNSSSQGAPTDGETQGFGPQSN
ncbi:MAG: hypothetical protein HY064_10425 [Bacteroidetes bacterium]|nr:hypothetical protein [Bacteroidota bacterium]